MTGLKKVHIEGRTDGLFLTLAFEQHYENNSADPVEILYSFPIPCQAIVLGMEAAMLGKPMEVAYRERADAEDIYEAGQEKRQFAAMVQRLSAGLCSVSLGTLRPGANAMLRLRIGVFVDVTSGRGRIVVPTVVNYPDGTGAVLPFAGQTSRDVMAEYPLTLRLALTDHAASALVSSPTHALSKKVRGEQATVTLSERATLDRDVIVILDNLPQTDAVQCADSHGAFGVTAFTPAPVGTPKSLDLDVLIDAAGPLRSIGGELPNVLNALASLLDDKDYIAVTRFGHSVSPLLKKSDGVMARVALADFPGIATDLGDVFTGQSLPPLELRENADILLITDGSTRAAYGLCNLAQTHGRRLFVLGVGAAPNEGVLRPAAAAGGGTYATLAPGEEPGFAIQALLGAIRSTNSGSQPQLDLMRLFGVLWTDGPASAWPAQREIIAVEFAEKTHGPAALATSNSIDQEIPVWRKSDKALTRSLLRTITLRRQRSLSGAERNAWSNRFGLAEMGDVWIAKASDVASENAGAARLLILPQMVAAGWRGFGIPARSAQGAELFRKRSKAPSTKLRIVSWRWPILGVAVLSILAGVGARVWFEPRPASHPFPLMLADYTQPRPISWAIWSAVAAASVAVLALLLFWLRVRQSSDAHEKASSDGRPERPQ